jgi:hypothetical protein
MRRVVCGCIPYYEDIIGRFRREHLSYRRFQPLHTPHNASGYIPTQILTWPSAMDVNPSRPLFMLHAILLKLLGGITGAANTARVWQDIQGIDQKVNCFNLLTYQTWESKYFRRCKDCAKGRRAGFDFRQVQKILLRKNDVFWDVMPCGSCKNRRFGGTYLHHPSGKNPRARCFTCQLLLTLFPSRWFFPLWWWRYVPLKRRFLQEPHGVTSQKTPFCIVAAAVRTSNLTKKIEYHWSRTRSKCNNNKIMTLDYRELTSCNMVDTSFLYASTQEM